MRQQCRRSSLTQPSAPTACVRPSMRNPPMKTGQTVFFSCFLAAIFSIFYFPICTFCTLSHYCASVISEMERTPMEREFSFAYALNLLLFVLNKMLIL